jgi:acyl-coenzyme A thioesterase PaaI-like protein
VTTAREKWFPSDPEPSPRRRRKHALAEELRGLVADLLMLDVEGATEDELLEVEERIAQARKACAAAPDIRRLGLHLSPGESSLFERSPLSGRSNALAAPLSMRFDGDVTRGEATYGEAYEGPPGLVHGGCVIAAFDDLLGVAQAASGVAGLTGTIEVKLRRGTPLHRRITYEAGVTSVTGRKVFAWGRSTLDGELLAEATCLFIEPRGGHPARALMDRARRPGTE